MSFRVYREIAEWLSAKEMWIRDEDKEEVVMERRE